MNRPRVLLTNDDGINAPGLAALADAFYSWADVDIVAPISEMSAMGHAITLSDPIKLTEIFREGNFFGYGIGGTPADCVKLAVNGGLTPKPELVVSGINQGANLGVDIIYSGTVSAAYEGTMLGIPSIAISVTSFRWRDFSVAAETAVKVARKVLKGGLPRGTLLNINVPGIPAEEIKGIKITRQGTAVYEEHFEKRLDPRNRVYFWLSGEKIYRDLDPELDEIANKQNYITITPIRYALTDEDFLPELKQWTF